MNGPSFKKVALRTSETVAAVALVMVFFLSFMALLGLFFPHGASLDELMLHSGTEESRRVHSGIELQLGDEPQTFIARLSQARRSVKDRPSRGIVWGQSQAGMRLEERHAVQTLSRSGATIAFGTGEEVVLEEDSLVVIRRLESRGRGAGSRRASVVAIEGEVRGRLRGADIAELEIVTANGTGRVLEASGNADFKVKINEDETSTFVVYDGVAEVTSAGKTVQLHANQTITVNRDEAPGTPQWLPDPPALLEPADDESLAYSKSPPDVQFTWLDSAPDREYRLEISRDTDFTDPLHEQTLSELEFLHGNLPAGRYYWRVAAVAGHAQGQFSAVRGLDLVLDDEPPGLEVSFPGGPVHAPAFLLHGIAEPGSRLFIEDQSVAVGPSGEFEYTLALDRGLNVVVVEAVDAAGNISYRSKRLNAKY